jgi:hypothetical protein
MGEIVAERWAASDMTKGVTGALPAPASACEGARLAIRALDARAGNDVAVSIEQSCADAANVADRGYLARFDGRAWSIVPTPGDALVSSVSIAPDGTLWAATEGPHTALWRARAGGAWETVALPPLPDTNGEIMSPREVWAKDARDVWVVAARYDDGGADVAPNENQTHRRYLGSVVFHSAPPTTALVEFPAEADIRSASADVSVPQPANAGCAHPFLLIARLPANAADAYDYPELRAAVRGSEILDDVELHEVMWKHERWVGATSDYETLEKIRTFALEKLPGNVPHPFCRFYPKTLRRFAIDGANGALADLPSQAATNPPP